MAGFIVGLAKKTLIANTLAVPADALFALPPGQLSTGAAWLAAASYALQMYFDFSGHVQDMAIGLAHMLGFTFRENLHYPDTRAVDPASSGGAGTSRCLDRFSR